MASKDFTLTQGCLKDLFTYNSETGIFIRIKKVSNLSTGIIAGSVTTNQNGKKYLLIGINNKRYYAHRLAWLYVYGRFPDNQIDHVNGDSEDNRIINLRDVTESENSKNLRIYSSNTSGICGVSFNKVSNKWSTYIQKNKKRINLGYFDFKDDAIAARKAAEKINGYHENHGRIKGYE